MQKHNIMIGKWQIKTKVKASNMFRVIMGKFTVQKLFL